MIKGHLSSYDHIKSIITLIAQLLHHIHNSNNFAMLHIATIVAFSQCIATFTENIKADPVLNRVPTQNKRSSRLRYLGRKP